MRSADPKSSTRRRTSRAWLVKIRVDDQVGLENLMSADEYEKYLEEVAH